jgi:hypothetical protein
MVAGQNRCNIFFILTVELVSGNSTVYFFALFLSYIFIGIDVLYMAGNRNCEVLLSV